MKQIFAVIGILVAGVAGYLLEPSIRPSLVQERQPAGKPAPEEPEEPAPQEKPVVPPPVSDPEPPAPTAPAWVMALKPEQLPDKVTLKRAVEFSAPGASQAMVMDPDIEATPVRVEGGDLIVSLVPGGPIEGRLPVMQTDLVERLGNRPPPATEPTPGGEPPVAVVDPEPMPEPEPEPAPEPEPEPAAKLDEVAIVKLMQDSIKAGEIKEFTYEQVLGWKAGEEEERDGVSYQTGLVAYEAETIFGVKTIQAQALIADGRIVRWIWPKSGMEIR